MQNGQTIFEARHSSGTVESPTTAWTEYRYIIISRETKRTLNNGQNNSDNNKTDILFGQLSKTNSAR